MAKAKWANSDLTADDIDNVEESEEFIPYSGEVPPRGLYRFKLRWIRTDVSSNGNDMFFLLAVLDGSWKPNHKQFDGYPMFDHIALTKASAPRMRAFVDALGVSSKDVINSTVTQKDDRGNEVVQKIGRQKIADQDLLLYINTQREDSKEYGEKLRPTFRGYQPAGEMDDDSGDDADDAGDSDEGAPF